MWQGLWEAKCEEEWYGEKEVEEGERDQLVKRLVFVVFSPSVSACFRIWIPYPAPVTNANAEFFYNLECLSWSCLEGQDWTIATDKGVFQKVGTEKCPLKFRWAKLVYLSVVGSMGNGRWRRRRRLPLPSWLAIMSVLGPAFINWPRPSRRVWPDNWLERQWGSGKKASNPRNTLRYICKLDIDKHNLPSCPQSLSLLPLHKCLGRNGRSRHANS